jgi:hypothetical protein
MLGVGKWEGSAVPAIEGKHIGGNVDEMGDHLTTSATSIVSVSRRYRYIETYEPTSHKSVDYRP